jgi:hypothetical protein
VAFFLLDNPPASAQFRSPRREPLSGIVVVHTSESIMDNVGPDTGAENVAEFISRRSDPGSYHELIDSDSVVPLVPDDYESFQVAADGHNRHAWGVSFACRSSDLDPDAEWTRRAIAIAGVRIREFWQRNGFDPNDAARWISRDDAVARRGPGLVTHGTVQPADRSDAWTTHPRRVELEQMLAAAITNTAQPIPVPPEEPDVYAYSIAGHEARGQLWLLYGPKDQTPIFKKYLRSADEVAIALTLYGAKDIGNQGALIDFIPGDNPGDPTTLNADDLAAKVAELLPGADGVAQATAAELVRRLAS